LRPELLKLSIRAAFIGTLTALAALHVLGAAGVRVGGWVFPEVGLGGWVALSLVALALSPRSALVRPLSLLLAAILLAATLAPLSSWYERSQRLEPLRARLTVLDRDGSQSQRTLWLELSDLKDRRSLYRRLGIRHHFRLEVDGLLQVPEDGGYRFHLAADDSAALRIDDREISRGAGSASAALFLAAGLHPIALDYRQTAGPAFLRLSWDRPSLLEVAPLERYLLSPPPRVASPRRVEREAVFYSLARIAWWGLASSFIVALGGALHGPKLRLLEGMRQALQRARRHPYLAPSLSVAAAAAFLLLGLEALLRPEAIEGIYFHPWTSEYMMQTVSIGDLRAEPFRSLWFNHIQPPILDGLRALLARFYLDAEDGELMAGVDQGLYRMWVLAYAGLAFLACLWLSRLTSRRFGVAAGLLLCLHPAVIFYATFLDGTFLSALWTLWFYYELWRMGAGRGSLPRLAASILLLFFTRSIYQWPFLVVVALALLLLGCDRRRVVKLVVWVGLVMALYLGKQRYLFGITMTSSFAADSFCKGLMVFCQGNTPVAIPPLTDRENARVLRHTTKLNGEYNWNQIAFLKRSFSQMVEYKQILFQQSIWKTLGIFASNLEIYFQPSTRHSRHVIADRLPWRWLYDRLLGGVVLGGLLAAAALSWLLANGAAALPRGVGLALPGAYIALVSVVFERGENMRYKFFIEPVLYVLLAAATYQTYRRLRARGAPGGESGNS
jgi:hypothetical protein